MNQNIIPPPFPRWLLALSILLTALTLAGGIWFYQNQVQQAYSSVENELSSIAASKVEQIVAWRAERLANGTFIMNSSFITPKFVEWMAARPAEPDEEMLAWLKGWQEGYDYEDVTLVDVSGNVLYSLHGSHTEIAKEAAQYLSESSREHKAVLTDLHTYTDGATPHLDVIVPLHQTREDGALQPVGALLLGVDPRQYLYPLIQSWPLPSQTAETMLVRREGEDVLFLNELRHQKDTALKIKIPLERTDFAAVAAVLGKQGIFQGLDYRGVSVLAYLAPVPGTNWFMVAKVDTTEAFAPVYTRSALILALILGLLATAIISVLMLWQQTQKAYYSSAYQMQIQRQALLQHFEYLVKYANDIILLAEEDQCIIEVNDRALEVYGYTREEMLALTIGDLVPTGERQLLQQRLQEAIEKGRFLEEAAHQKKDGLCFPVEISACLIDIEGKRYIQEIIRDITERRLAEDKLRVGEERFRNLFEQSAVTIADISGRFIQVSRKFCDMLGYSEDELLELTIRQITHPDDLELDLAQVQRMAAGQIESFFIEKRYLRKDGQPVWCNLSVTAVWDTAGKLSQTIGVAQDITERKLAEKEIQLKDDLLRMTGEMASLGGWEFDTDTFEGRWTEEVARIHDLDTLRMDVNPGMNFYYGDSREKIEKAVQAAIEHAQPYDMECEIVSATGIHKWIRTKGQPVLEGKKVVKVRGIFQEITEQRRAREELRRSTALYRAIARNIPDGAVFVVDQDLCYRVVEGCLAAKIGMAREQLEGHTIDEAVEQGTIQFVKEPFQRALAGELLSFETEYQGQVLWTQYVPLRDDSDSVIAAMALSLDISQRKAYERKIEQLNRIYAVLSQVNQAIVREKERDRLFAEICRVAVDYGQFRMAWIGLLDEEKDAIHPVASSGHVAGYLDALMSTYLKGSASRALKARSLRENRLVVCNDIENDPQMAPWREAALKRGYRASATLPFEVGGKIIGNFNLFASNTGCFTASEIKLLEELSNDLSFALTAINTEEEREIANRALRESESRFRKLIENLPQRIFVKDHKFIYRYCNGLLADDLKLSPLDVVGKTDFDLYPRRQAETYRADDRRILDAGKIEDTEEKSLLQGQERWIRIVKIPLKDDRGKNSSLLGIFEDITQRKQIEEEIRKLNLALEQRVAERTAELEAKNKELETFAYSVSHDLKAPLRGIDGYSRLLLESYSDQLDDEGKQFLHTVRGAALQMGQLIDDLLAYSRLERRGLSIGTTQLKPLVLVLLAERADEMEARGVTLQLNLPFDEVSADEEGLSMALRNLLDNALKFTQDIPEILIEIGGQETENSHILWVRDNGIGFDMKYHDRIFNIFQRLHRAEDYPGTGIGLAIVHKALERMKGKVWAESTPGQGAKFYLELPK